MKRFLICVLLLTACGEAAAPKPAASAQSESTASAAVSSDQGERLIREGKWAEAKSYYDAKLKLRADDLVALYYGALARERLGIWPEADALYTRVLAIAPYHPEALTNASAHELEVGNYAAARKRLEPAIKKPGAACSIRQNYALALAGLDDAQANNARDAALGCDREAGLFRLFDAQIRATHHKADAIALLTDLPSKAPNDVPSQRSAGATLREMGEFARCVKVLSAALTHGAHAETLTERGLCQIGLNQEAAAGDDFAKAIAANPSFADAYYYLGGVKARAKDPKAALDAYKKFVQFAPAGDSKIEAAKKRIEVLSAAK